MITISQLLTAYSLKTLKMSVKRTLLKYTFICLSTFVCGSLLAEGNVPSASNINKSGTVLLDSELDDIKLNKALDTIILRNNLLQQLQSVPQGSSIYGPKFELGKQLFFSKSLSKGKDVACASCHHPMLGGGDSLSLSVGVNPMDENIVGPGRQHDGNKNIDPRADGAPNIPRNAATIFNLHLLQKTAFWDGRVERIKHGDSFKLVTPDSLMNLADPDAGDDFIQAQARFPLISIHEMFGYDKHKRSVNSFKRQLIVDQLRSNEDEPSSPWLMLFQDAFNMPNATVAEAITLDNITSALAHYQRSMVLMDNPWFDYIRGNKNAISQEAKRGALLFYSPENAGGFNCNACHSGISFSDENFYNIATPQLGRGKDQSGNDHGRLLHTSNINDKYKFRTPPLLNVEATGPWGHAGAFADLRSIIKHHFDPIKANQQYDFSLTHLQQKTLQLSNLERSKTLTKEVSDYYQRDSVKDLLVPSSNSEEDAKAIEQFLLTLTDPCIKNTRCIEKWMPDSNDEGPDGELLHAVISKSQTLSNDSEIAFTEQSVVQEPINSANIEQQWFSDVSAQSGLSYTLPPASFSDEYHLMGGGVAVDDINRDGWPDLFISHSMQPGKLFINQRNGRFNDETMQRLGKLTGRQLAALFMDVDNDGDKDLMLVEDDINQGYFRLFKQSENGKFNASANKAGIGFKRFTHSLAAGDYDADGDLDLFASHWGDVVTKQRQGYLWENDSKGGFFDVSQYLPQTRVSPLYPSLDVNFTPIFSDIDNDNDLDLLIAADYHTTQILKNDNRRFVDSTSPVISDENGMGSAVGDYDNDGDLDWFVSSIWNPIEEKTYKGGQSGNRLYNNDGKGNFTDKTDYAGVREGYWGWGACFADFNNDGWLDIFHTNGMRTGQIAEESQVGQFYEDPSRLFINNKNGTFSEMSEQWGIIHNGQGRGIACFDYDQDGDIDIIIANNGAPPTLYRNNNLATENNFLQIYLQYSDKNPDGIGTKIRLKMSVQQQMREIRLGSNYLSNDPPMAHFGVGEASKIDSVRITWPDGVEHILHDVVANQALIVERD
jgi:cytochrome c peroxidase